MFVRVHFSNRKLAMKLVKLMYSKVSKISTRENNNRRRMLGLSLFQMLLPFRNGDKESPKNQ